MSNERSAGANPLAAARQPHIYNLLLEEANTEYVQHLATDTRKFLIQCRDPRRRAKFCFSDGESGTNYITVSGAYWDDNLSITDMWIYVQAELPNTEVEIICWN